MSEDAVRAFGREDALGPAHQRIGIRLCQFICMRSDGLVAELQLNQTGLDSDSHPQQSIHRDVKLHRLFKSVRASQP